MIHTAFRSAEPHLYRDQMLDEDCVVRVNAYAPRDVLPLLQVLESLPHMLSEVFLRVLAEDEP